MFQLTKDSVSKSISATFASFSVAIVALIFIFLFKESAPAIKTVGIVRFFTDSSWLPEPIASEGSFGVATLIIGSTIVSSLALLIATPIGILAAICLVFYCSKKTSKYLRLNVELLAGVPSVVFGLWGLTVIAPIIHSVSKTGLTSLTAALVLAIMLIPTIVLSSIHALENAYKETKESAIALGISKESNIIRIVLPLAWPSLGIGMLLAFTRAIGETMIVVMLCGNIAQMPKSILEPVRTLTANIALEMSYAYQDHRSSLFFTGLVLMTIVSIALLTLEALKRKSI